MRFKVFNSNSLNFYYVKVGVLSQLLEILSNFIEWAERLTWIDFILIFWPLLSIDFFRTLLKVTVVGLHALYSKIHKVYYPAYFTPKVSIVIPAHNEEKVIQRSIESALDTDYPNKEIVVVDDGSTDRTYQLAYPYAEKGLIKLLHNKVASGSKSGALNLGLMFATGDIIVTVDADTILEHRAIKEAVKPLFNPRISAVSGNVRVLRGEHGNDNLLVKLQAYEYLLSLELGRRLNSIFRTLLMISGAFGVFWKKYVESLGRYDKDTMTEDFDVTIKMRKLGNRLFFAEKALAWTFVPERWRDWRRQRLRWTIGQIETLWKHRNVFRKENFDLTFVLAIYDMLFMDFILLFVRITWLIFACTMLKQQLFNVLILSIIVYTVLEMFSAITAGALSPRKQDLKKIYLVPIVVIFYRPLYALVRFEAYIRWASKKKTKW
ncbi:MAG: glycosyltransferase [Candidatus Bathyarchaeia archaeon]